MALWKPFRGNRSALDTVEKRDGYIYFCIDDGSLFFDYTDAEGNLQRKQINAKEAERLLGYNIATTLNNSDTEIPTSKAVLDALNEKVAASGGIKDVEELPTENISDNVIYRLPTAKFISNYYSAVDSWTCYCVSSLPEIGESVSHDMVNITAYYSMQDGQVYGYADSNISNVMGVEAGWYPIEVLGQAFDTAWGGVTTDPDSSDDSVKLLFSYSLYTHQNGWNKLIFGQEEQPEFDIKWNGEFGDRFVLDMSSFGFDNNYFVKVSDRVPTTDQLIGGHYTQTSGYTCDIVESVIDSITYPGALSIDGGVVICYDSAALNAALGLPEGYITEGTYFVHVTDEDYTNYTSHLVSSAKITKIDSKYLDLSYVDDQIENLGLSTVARSGDYNDLSGKPNAVLYDTQSLTSTQQANVRSNIDVYGKAEVYNKAEVDVVLSYSKGLSYTLNDGNESYTVTNGNNTDATIVIPAIYLGKPVTSIGNLAFYNRTALKNIVISNFVTSIGNSAFSDCKSLTSVIIPDSVTSIGNGAFQYCTSLTSIVIPDSVTSIGHNTFWGCSSLTSVIIPDSVTSISNSAFYGCKSLTDVYYTGSEEQWTAITIEGNNNPLTNATIHYNYVNSFRTINEQLEAKTDKDTLSIVATSGSYTDLTDKPTIPAKTSDLTNDSDFATNESVDEKIAGLVNSAPEALNTLGELATALEAHEDAYDALLEVVGKKADQETVNELKSKMITLKVTDLTNTSWLLNEYLDLDQDIDFNITYTSNNSQYNRIFSNIYIDNDDGGSEYQYLYYGDIHKMVYQNYWSNQDKVYRHINIIGGTDVANIELINWLYANGELIEAGLDLSQYQTKTDDTLTTTNKEIVKAINEVNSTVNDAKGILQNITEGYTKVGVAEEADELAGVSNLTTNNKTTIGAINELKTSVETLRAKVDPRVTDLTNTTWHIPAGWTVTESYGSFMVNCQITRSIGGSAYTDAGTQLKLGYTTTAPETRAVLPPGGGFITETNYYPFVDNLVLCRDNSYNEFGSSLDLTITFTGGNDATFPSLIDWLYENGELESGGSASGLITVDKIGSINASLGNEGIWDEGDGICWDSTYTIYDDNGDELSSGTFSQSIPLVAGENITFSYNNENSTLAINSTSSAVTGAIQKVDTESDIPQDDTKLYRYIDSDGEPSHLVEVVSNAVARSSGAVFTPIHEKDNQELTSTEAFYNCFGAALSSSLAVSALSKAYTLLYKETATGTVLTSGIKLGSSKAAGSITLTPTQDCTLTFIKYYTYVANTGTINGYDSSAAVDVNGTVYTFEDDTTPLEITLDAGTEYTISSHPEGYSGRIIITSIAFGGDTFHKYELARVGEVNKAVTDLTTLVNTTKTNIIDNELPKKTQSINDEIGRIKEAMGDVQIFDKANLPGASANHLNKLVRCNGALYQCVGSGDGVQKTFSFTIAGTSDITDAHVGDEGTLYKEIGNEFADYMTMSDFSKLYRNNDSFKLGSSSATGTVTFNNISDKPMSAIKIGLRAYNTKQSFFEITCGDIIKQVVVTDTVNEQLITLYENADEELYLGDSITITTIATGEGKEGAIVTYDNRGLVTRLLVDFGEVNYSWALIGGAGNSLTSIQVPITYYELKELKNKSKLIPGMFYRITDYQCTTVQENARAMDHRFDIIVQALSENTLSENASADYHYDENGNVDGYFQTMESAEWDSLKMDAVTVYYSIYEDYNDTNDIIEGMYNADDKFIGYDYLENDDGEVVPVIYKTDTASEDPEYVEPDYADIFYYVGVEEYNGELYDKWRMICETSDNGPYWDGSTGYKYIYTNIIVEDNTIIDDVIGGSQLIKCANLAAWELKYCIDNDSSRFTWVDPYGCGVIYYMKDEYNNECPYDFKNIQFIRCLDEEGNLDTENGEDTWCYTFGGKQCDRSIRQGDLKEYNNNSIGTLYTGCDEAFSIPNNVFLGTSECMTKNNRLGTNCTENTFGDNCQSNTFGDNCSYNTFGYGCNVNIFGYSCHSNTFGNDCSSNTFGNSCSYNTFGYGCHSNIFGNSCTDNTFGSTCSCNTFGNDCIFNTFGASKINPINYVMGSCFENCCSHIKLKNNQTVDASIQNITVSAGVRGTHSKALELEVSRNAPPVVFEAANTTHIILD